MSGKNGFQFEPTQEQRNLVVALAAVGTPHKHICLEILRPDGKPISEPTLRKAFREELDNGMQRANGKVVNVAYKMATAGTIPAMTIFWLKTRCGWKEPAQDVNLSLTYGQLVEQAMTKRPAPERPALTVVPKTDPA